MDDEILKSRVQKSCAVCTYANHDPSLGDSDDVICIVNPNKPKLVPSNDTCLKHESKYKGLKVIIDKGHLMEYDSEKTFGTKRDRIPDEAITDIGEEEWQQ